MPWTPADPRDGTITLEAFADTVLPGAKRGPDDLAIAGAAPGPGAVEAGALELLSWDATGMDQGLDGLATLLNEHAARYARTEGIELDPGPPPFVALPFEAR